jgi:hypothetical protein
MALRPADEFGEDVAHLGHSGDVVAGERHEELKRGKALVYPGMALAQPWREGEGGLLSSWQGRAERVWLDSLGQGRTRQWRMAHSIRTHYIWLLSGMSAG